MSAHDKPEGSEMKPSEVYLRAAEIKSVEGDYVGCCVPIADACEEFGDREAKWKFRHKFAELFQPEHGPVFWWEIHEQESRVLALLFMHEIAKEGESEPVTL